MSFFKNLMGGKPSKVPVAVPGAAEPPRTASTQPALIDGPFIPMLRSMADQASLENHLKAMNDPKALEALPFAMPLAWSDGELVVTFGIDHPDSVQMLAPRDCRDALGMPVDGSELMRRGMANFFNQFDNQVSIASHPQGLAHRVVGFGGYVSNLLFLDTLSDMARDLDFKGPPLVAVPARGALLIADSSRPEALKALPGMIAEIQAQPDAGRSLTRAIYLSEEGKPQRRVA